MPSTNIEKLYELIKIGTIMKYNEKFGLVEIKLECIIFKIFLHIFYLNLNLLMKSRLFL